jgi:hypothetical protein
MLLETISHVPKVLNKLFLNIKKRLLKMLDFKDYLPSNKA